MTTREDLPKQISLPSEDEDDNQDSTPVSNSRLSVEQGEPRHVTCPEAVGLEFHSFIPQADITSQVHFFSHIEPESDVQKAGLQNGDRMLQINGINVTNLEHEDVRKLMQLMTPIVLTVAHDPKYLLLLQEPVSSTEEKLPEPPLVPDEGVDAMGRRKSRFDLQRYSSMDSMSSSVSTAAASGKARPCEILLLTKPNESSGEEPLRIKQSRMRKSKKYDGYGLVLKYQQHLHVIGEVEEASPAYRAGLRENDVILFVSKTNVEKMHHEEVKVMIRAMALASHYVDLTLMSKLDIPKYKTLTEKGQINWSDVGLEK